MKQIKLKKRREGTKRVLARARAPLQAEVGVHVDGGRTQKRRRTDRTKVEGPLGNASAVPTASSREMSITLPSSESFMRASGLNQSLHLHHLPGKYSPSQRKISFNY